MRGNVFNLPNFTLDLRVAIIPIRYTIKSRFSALITILNHMKINVNTQLSGKNHLKWHFTEGEIHLFRTGHCQLCSWGAYSLQLSRHYPLLVEWWRRCTESSQLQTLPACTVSIGSEWSVTSIITINDVCESIICHNASHHRYAESI